MEAPKLIAVLGAGGMAEVFLAIRQGKGALGAFMKLVVVKQLRTSAIEPDAMEMFHDEARISARLNHPNVVQTHEVGFDGKHYRLEMEYLDGQSLHRVVSRAKKAGKAISHDVAVAVVREVLAGLHYAHQLRDYDGTALGIIHRDVSPQNIFVTYDGRVKLLDFGIAKVAGKLAVTQLGVVKGKMRYMAPEQATAGEVDARADVFAAGVVLWQLLVGRSYWNDLDDLSIFERIKQRALPPRPRAVDPSIPEALDAICARALAFDPDDRYASADEFQLALETCGVTTTSAMRTLSSLAAELFADVREAIRSEIEKAAARPTEEIVDEPLTKLFQSAQGSGAHTRQHTPRRVAPAAPVRKAAQRTRNEAPDAWRVRWPLVALGIVAVLSVASLAMFSLTHSGSRIGDGLETGALDAAAGTPSGP